MNVITIGSKIVDDAIAFCGSDRGIKNVNRITNISPFVLGFNAAHNKDILLPLDKCSDYVSYVHKAEMTGCLEVSEEFDYVIIDVADARFRFLEVEYANGKAFRITDNNINSAIISKFKEETKSNKRITIKECDPLSCNADELKELFEEYLQWIKVTFPEKKIILECNRHAYQTLSEDGNFTISEKITGLMRLNNFYDRCEGIVSDITKCDIIPALSYICADALKKDFFVANKPYYRYLTDCVADVAEGKTDYAKRLHEYQYSVQRYYEKTILNRLSEDISKSAKGDMVLIGATADFEKELCAKTGRSVSLRLDIKDFDSEKILSDKLSMPDKHTQLCVVVSITAGTHILRTLKDAGLDVDNRLVLATHGGFTLNRFVGYYEDVFGNVFDIKAISDINVSGIGNHIFVGEQDPSISYDITVGDDNIMVFENNSQTMLNKAINAKAVAASYIKCGEFSALNNDNRIYAGKFGTINIGKFCLMATDVLLHCNGLKSADNSIIVEDWTWIGYRATLLPGAHIRTGSIVAARATVAEDFPKNTLIAGDPAKVIKNNVTYHRNNMIYDINAVPEQYRGLTE